MASTTECTQRQTQDKVPKSVAFEMWFKPVVENARKPNFSPMRGDKNISKEYLRSKLREAETRRKNYELGNLARLAAKDEHIRQVKAFAVQQRKLAEEKHKQKMDMYEKKKNALDQALLKRLIAKDEHIKVVQATVQVLTEEQSKIAEEKLNQKLLQSVEITEAKKQALKEKLQAHEKRVKDAQNVVHEMTELHSKVTEEKIQKKMVVSTEKRQRYLQGLKLRMHEKSLNAEQKRQTLDEIHSLQKKIYEEKYQQKMEKYDENRMAVMRAKQEQLDAHNKHVERVCLMAKEKRLQAQRG